MTEETTKEISDVLEMFSTELQVAQRSILSSGERTSEDADLQSMRDMQDSDSVSDWMTIQWAILRDAGLLNE